MLKNHIKVALQTLMKHKGYTIINVFGLSLGFTCCILIAFFVADELSYDRYHEKADRIFKVVTDSRSPDSESQFALTPAPLGGALVRDYLEVETATRLFTFLGDVAVRSGDKIFNENRFFAGDSTFFEVFSIPMLDGNPGTALIKPNTVVLTQETARKYFGREDPVGKSLTVTLNNPFEVEVTGVIADVPSNTHFHFDFLLSLSSFGGFSNNPSFITNINFHTYIVLREGASAKDLEEKLSEASGRYAAPQIAERFGQSYRERLDAGHSTEWSLIPLTDIRLRSHRAYEIEPNASITTVYIFSTIAIIILIIACVNFMNLSMALSTGRSKDIAMRKIAGSGRGQLIAQLLFEPMLLSIFAMLLSIVLIETALPVFNTISGKQIEAGFFSNGVWLLILFPTSILIGITAGSYSAFLLSSLKPVDALKGDLLPSYRISWVRQSLVVFQFTISIALITCTLIVHNQLGYIHTRGLGFEKEHVLVIKRAQSLGQKYDAFRQLLLEKPEITNVAASFSLPGQLFGRSIFRDADAPPDVNYGIHQDYAFA
jgi:putative ABC transport system permease protein